MTIVLTTLVFLLVSFGIGTVTGYLIAFGMRSDYEDQEDEDSYLEGRY